MTPLAPGHRASSNPGRRSTHRTQAHRPPRAPPLMPAHNASHSRTHHPTIPHSTSAVTSWCEPPPWSARSPPHRGPQAPAGHPEPTFFFEAPPSAHPHHLPRRAPTPRAPATVDSLTTKKRRAKLHPAPQGMQRGRGAPCLPTGGAVRSTPDEQHPPPHHRAAMESGDHGWCSHILQVLVLSWLSRRTSATRPTAATFCLPPPLARAQLGQRQCSRIQRAVHITPSCGLFTTTMALPSPAQAMARCDVPPCWACHAVQQYLNPLGCSEFMRVIHRGSNTTKTRSAGRGQAADLLHSPTKKSARWFIVSVRFSCALCAVS
ncbi:uncharacterized protein LOC125554459 [Triticum urartu]|uniref:uncharacterized protein LOC125554459 n=1 Tax=Triticum urartu TaxID=4572 RepID=UPI002042C3A2|nr:uncharacterized protein LOC125554459 [Triticum urartu]